MNLNKPNSSNPLPHPRFTVCHRHPGEPITGFCAACLSERLAGLDPDGIKSIVETGQSSKSIELSRSKSCSSHNGCKRNGVVISTTVEPRRKSCDVRGRSSLSSLFDMDDGSQKGGRFIDVSGCGGGLRFGKEDEDLGVEEIRVLEQVPICRDEEEWRTMKEHIDLECRRKTMSKSKDLKNIAGSIWIAAASGFSKKLQKWKQKQRKIRMSRNDDGNGGVGNCNRVAMEVERVNVRNLRQWRERETRSEVGDYGFGRRSCDTEPRFSVDAARASVDCPRLDEGRASWDGYLIGRSSVNRPNRMLTVVKDDDDDDQFVEDVISVKNGNVIDKSPGGTEQTRDYYGEGLGRRRRSFDRSSSNRRASSVELEELRAISNSKISPASVELFHGAKVLLTKNDVKLPNLSPIKTERMESSDSLSIGPSSIVDEGNGNNKFHVKKLTGWRKAWTNWGGLSQKQADPKFKFTCEEYNEESKVAEKVTSTGTHVSSSSSSSISGSFMRSSTETKFSRLKQQEQPFTLERNKSTRYSPSPNNHDNSLLRFYLTPSRGIRSGNCSKTKSRLQSSQDVARNALRL